MKEFKKIFGKTYGYGMKMEELTYTLDEVLYAFTYDAAFTAVGIVNLHNLKVGEAINAGNMNEKGICILIRTS